MNKQFAQLCTPSKLYFLISIVSLIFAFFKHFNIVLLIVKLLFALVWTLVLSCLCDKGFSYLSWFLVLFPYFLILLAFMGLYSHREGMTNTMTNTSDSTGDNKKKDKMKLDIDKIMK
jgi:hypothetical protein